MLSACLLTKNAFYLLNYVSWPLSVDTSSIWPQMRPFSSCYCFIHSSSKKCYIPMVLVSKLSVGELSNGSVLTGPSVVVSTLHVTVV